MARKTTPSFVTEIPLIVNVQQGHELEKRFRAGQNLYNAVLGEALIRMEQVKKSEYFKAAKKLKGEDNKEKRNSLYDKAKKINRFTDFDLQEFGRLTAKQSVWIEKKLDSHTIQKIATRAFKAVSRVLFGKAKRVRFKTFDRMKSLEGKDNLQGIRWRLHQFKRPEVIGKKKDYRNKIKCSELILAWKGLELIPIIDWLDPVIVHGINSKVKYCRIVWRYLNGVKRWYLQLINEGLPYQKPKNYVTEGKVGLDLNISNLAVVADNSSHLLPFADKVPSYEKEIKALQRKMQRSQRIHNPGNYEPDFEKKVGNKIVVKKGKVCKGKKTWKNTGNYKKLRRKKAELERRKASYAKSQNRKMVNEVLRTGNQLWTEKVAVKGWQKRYGKAISSKSPGFVQSELKRKAEQSGGSFTTFSTRKTCLSQTHLNGNKVKKKLSDRIHYDQTGVVMQRDLFTAYLARFIDENDCLDIKTAENSYSKFSDSLNLGWKNSKNVN